MSPPEALLRIVEADRVELLAVECRACARLSFPRTLACTYCGTVDDFDEKPVGPAATLWGWTVVNAAPPGYEGPVPYGFGVVEVGGVLRVLSRIDETDLDRLHFGQTGLLVVDRPATDGPAVWTFVPGVDA